MATENNTPGRPAVLSVGINFDGMTWADLRAFVALCGNIPDDDEVGMRLAENQCELAGLEEWVHLPASRLP